jgi:Na+/proline symporter
MIGSLGFLAAGMGLQIPKELVGMTTVITIGSVLPSWTVLVLVFMLLAGLVAVLDSQLNSAASLVGHDIKNKFSSDTSEAANIRWSRGGMFALAVMALGIANWPGMTLLTIFLFFGVMRATVWWPMMLHLWKPNLITERGMFWYRNRIRAWVPNICLRSTIWWRCKSNNDWYTCSNLWFRRISLPHQQNG